MSHRGQAPHEVNQSLRTQTQERRDIYLKQAEAEEAKITRLEQMYYMLEDPATQELMHDVVVGIPVQNGVPVQGNGNGTGEKHYVGMQRVRDYVREMKVGQPFSVHDIYTLSVAHRGHGDPKYQHPEFERQRKASIGIALSSMAKGGDLEIVKQGRGRKSSVYRRPEGK